MKKTYISPVAQVTYLTSHAIMSGSIKGVSGANGLGAVIPVPTTPGTSGATATTRTKEPVS